MKKIEKLVLHIFSAAMIAFLASSVIMANLLGDAQFLWFCIPIYIAINIVPSVFNGEKKTKRLKQMANGCELLRLFLFSTILSIGFIVLGLLDQLPLINPGIGIWLGHMIVVIVVEAVVFWNGIIRVYLTSTQLGIRWRVWGALCGMVPIANLVLLGIILRTVEKEVRFENDKIIQNEQRKAEQICKTKYPILMVHGVFFRDYKYRNYWGRIPKELVTNGATVYYGNHSSAASVEESGRELAERIKQIVKETGCEKVNIIAHSKGGLDGRQAVAKNGIEKHVASLTTICSPHRGCEFADYILSKIPEEQKERIADAYNTALRKLGDAHPDFIAAVYDLTADVCRKRNEELVDAEGVFYQSVGSKLNVPSGGRFPLNLTTHMVQYFDGDNDGLVGEESFAWGEKYHFLTVKGKRGISHGDVIDLNHENFDEFDVREFYVQLVKDLKERGF